MTVMLESLDDFNLGTLQRVAWEGEPVAFGEQALARMRTARGQFLDLLEREPNLHVYGVTTGYDEAADTIVGPEERARLATKPVDLLAAGVGEPLPDRVVRAMNFSRLINYVSGYTALSLETAQQVADMLDGPAAAGRSAKAGLAGRAAPAHQSLRRPRPRALPGPRRERDRERQRLHARADR
jgi:histidine ammonia-lyase